MTKNVPVEAVCALTGLGPRQVFRLTREGRIPAQIVGRRFVMTPGQYDRLMREGIGPERTKKATDHPRMLHSINKEAS